MDELIRKQDALDAFNGNVTISAARNAGRVYTYLKMVTDRIKALPPVQPERLTDDDFETIRIHLNAYKEKLCNQRRWEEAEEYQRIIDRFMTFASAQPNHNAEVSKMEIIRCKDCKRQNTNNDFRSMWCREMLTFVKPDEFCSRAEKRGEAE